MSYLSPAILEVAMGSDLDWARDYLKVSQEDLWSLMVLLLLMEEESPKGQTHL